MALLRECLFELRRREARLAGATDGTGQPSRGGDSSKVATSSWWASAEPDLEPGRTPGHIPRASAASPIRRIS
jgi:hypothetical protein